MVVFQNDKAACGTSHPLKSLGSKATGEGKKPGRGRPDDQEYPSKPRNPTLQVIKPLEKKTVSLSLPRRYRFLLKMDPIQD